MVWTHCANSLLHEDLQATALFGTMSYYHGLVAPTFFWLAGLMRGLGSVKADHAKPKWPSVKRLLMILGIGYLLHIPWGQLSTGDFGSGTWAILFQSDVLQCLAISGLLLLALERTGRARLWLAVFACVLVILLADLLAEVHTGWAMVDGFLNYRTGSLFPLFPWMAFVMAGFVCGQFPLGGWTALLGFGLMMSTLCIPAGQLVQIFFIERLGSVLLLASGVKVAWSWWERTNRATIGFGWLLLAGRQSLVAYVAHLLMLYALPITTAGALAQGVGRSLPPLAVVAIFVVILLSTLLCCQWTEQREKRPLV
jgi:uncharacterized membrane protein